MKKIVFIGFYEMKEHVMYIGELLQKYSYEVINYPLFQYAYDSNDKLPNYKDHLNNFIQKNNPDIILWWFLDVPSDVFKYIKKNNPNIYYIMYNGDDPLNINTETLERAKIFDLIVTPCKENIRKYTMYSGVKNVIWIPPGYDPNYFFPINNLDLNSITCITNIDDNDIKYISDISIHCFNLLDDNYYNQQYIKRKELIDNVVQYAIQNNKVFKIYGPIVLKQIYPQYYNGEVEYINLHRVFNYSKINICTHNYCNKELSLTDNEIRILGCGSLLFMDKIKGIEKVFKDGENCIIIDKDNYLNQITTILNNYDDYSQLKTNGYELSKQFTWDKFIEKVHIEVSKYFFSPDTYKELYDDQIIETDISYDKLWNIWLEYGLKENHICYDFNIPDNFDHKTYATMNNLDVNNIKKLYLHWYQNGKHDEYINSKKSGSRDINISDVHNFNIDPDGLFELYTVFNKIKNIDKNITNKALDELSIICDNNPRLKVNECLEEYFNFYDN